MSVLFPPCIRQRSGFLPTLCRRAALLLLVLAFTPILAAAAADTARLPNSSGTGQTRLAFPVPTAQPDTTTNPAHQGHQEPQPAQEPISASDISGSAHRTNQTDALSSATAQIFQNRPLRVGIISLWEQPVTTEALMNTLETIEKAFAPYPVEIFPRIPSPKLEHLIETGNIDVFIASSGFSMRMSRYGVLPVATLITDLQPNPNTGVATTFLVRADEEKIKTIADLKDKRLSASYASAFMSYRTGLGEIAVRGYDPEHFFSDIHYTGDSENAAIASRLDTHKADVAMVRACWLEHQPPEVRARYRVLEPREDPTLHCIHTSRTYPNIMVSVLEGSAPGAAHVIARTLLSIKEIAPGHHWGVATDLRPVNRLYRELKIENFAYLRDITFKDWLTKNLAWCVLTAAMILGLAFHSWRVGYLVRVRTAELETSIEEERKAQFRLDEMRGRMERMQKATIVGQLSNLIAHELAQPLAAVQYYLDGMKTLLSRQPVNTAMLEKSRIGIEQGLERTKAIVAKVRGYSRNQTRRDRTVSLKTTIDNVLTAISPELQRSVAFKCESVEGIEVLGDALELELLMRNLIKNAFEAAASAASDNTSSAQEVPTVSVRTQPDPTDKTDRSVLITIENTGLQMTNAAFNELTTPLITTKAAGHGLGVPIAIAIAEASGGRLTFFERPQGGVIAQVRLLRAGSYPLKNTAAAESSSSSHYDIPPQAS
jgi:signal transduction histidine kinase